MTCRFAGPTSGPVARSYSSLLTDHAPDWLLCAGCGTSSPMCRESCSRSLLSFMIVRLSKPLPSRSSSHATSKWCAAQTCLMTEVMKPSLVTTALRSLRLLVVCVGGGSCSESFVGTTIFASGRTPSTYRSSLCTGDEQARRSGFAASAPTQLTAP